MRARWIEAWGGELRGGVRPDPEPSEGELLLEVQACGVGLTVLNYMRGDLGRDPAKLPRIPGHEIVGRVRAVGPGVHPSRVGETVAAFFYMFCGECRYCLTGDQPLCLALRGYLGVDLDGGYAELARVPARNAIRLPDGLDPVLATTIPDAIATPVHVARLVHIAPGERVCVIGAGGGIGVHMVQVAQLYGAEVAGLERGEAKLAALEHEYGAIAINSTNLERTELPGGWDGRADVVVDLLGTTASMQWSVARLDRRGRLVLLTTFRDVSFRVSAREAVLSGLTVIGSRYAGVHELGLAAAFVAAGRVSPVVGEVTGLDEVDRLHELLRRGTLLGRGAIALA